MASTNRLSPIPRPPTKPVVGNMLSLDSSAPVQNLARLAKQLGPIFWLDMMGAPFVVVSGADLVDELSDEKRFDKAVRGPLRRVRAVAGALPITLFHRSTRSERVRTTGARLLADSPGEAHRELLAVIESGGRMDAPSPALDLAETHVFVPRRKVS